MHSRGFERRAAAAGVMPMCNRSRTRDVSTCELGQLDYISHRSHMHHIPPDWRGRGPRVELTCAAIIVAKQERVTR